MSAEPDVRSVVGTLGAPLKALAVTALTATPDRVDGVTVTSTTIGYTLSIPAFVTAELLNAGGTSLATLFEAEKVAGKQSFVFTPAGVPDGSYRIRISAKDASGRTVRVTTGLLISKTLLQFAGSTQLVSPNGDGRLDSLTFTVALAAPAEVALSLVAGKTTIPILQTSLPQGAQTLRWTGRALSGARIGDGNYHATIVVGTAPFTISHWLPLTVDTRAPRLILASIYPPRLNLTEEATIAGTLNGRAWTMKSGARIFRMPVKRLRSLRAIARDAAGNTSPLLSWPR
jgi:hypothetical protein